MPKKNLSLIGKRFGRLTVKSVHDVVKKNYTRYLCGCDCGQEKVVYRLNLTSGDTKSCGCAFIEQKRFHRKTKTPTWYSWAAMLSRCRNPKGKLAMYKGISVCKKWEKFGAFYSDMGERPPGTSLDRMDGRKGYFPKNCRWATASEQAINRRNRYTGEYSPYRPEQHDVR